MCYDNTPPPAHPFRIHNAKEQTATQTGHETAEPRAAGVCLYDHVQGPVKPFREPPERAPQPRRLTASGRPAEAGLPFDLHVLSMPPAFVLSQDQTLKLTFSDARASET